jgi:hypothetical protein
MLRKMILAVFVVIFAAGAAFATASAMVRKWLLV